jgi:tRNA pseudouridine65 synthase
MNPTQELKICYDQAGLVAVHKPAGLLVHPSQVAAHERETAAGLLSSRLGCRVHPCHRLDKATSGLLLFATEPALAAAMSAQFRKREVEKTYLAVVRGWILEATSVDYPLKPNIKGFPGKRDNEPKAARTRFHPLARTEVDWPSQQFPTSRYSLVLAQPETGRLHQIRRHAKHLSHPIIGDTRYGDTRHNHAFLRQFDNRRLLLAAIRLRFQHPATGSAVSLEHFPETDMARIIQRLGWERPLGECLQAPDRLRLET